jgi:hypothetical protein
VSGEKDRRDETRHTAWFSVRLDAGELGECMALTRNVSRRGTLLCSAERFTVGAPVTIEVHLQAGEEPPRRIQGTIVRLTPNDEDPDGLWPYKIAVEFDDPDLVVVDRIERGDGV